MKIGGIDPTTLPIEVFLVLPRGDQEIVFRAHPVPSMDEFEALCPRPNAAGQNDPRRLGADGGRPHLPAAHVRLEPDAARLHGRQVAGAQPESSGIRSTRPIPSTWKNWSTDLRNGGLSDIECQRVMNLVLEANCLDEAKLKKAREVFLAGQEAKPASSGLPTEPQNTPSGAPASA